VHARIVHARIPRGHGYFECYAPLTDLTMDLPAPPLGEGAPCHRMLDAAAAATNPPA
jgi:hypothetical protein